MGASVKPLAQRSSKRPGGAAEADRVEDDHHDDDDADLGEGRHKKGDRHAWEGEPPMKTAVKEAVVPSRPAPASLDGLSVSHLCVLNGTG